MHPSLSHAASADIRIDVRNPTVELSPHLYGLFFEDINYGADGGLYAELVQNRSFESYEVDSSGTKISQPPLHAWQKIERDGASAEIEVASANPLNAKNRNYLEIRIAEAGTAGVSNGGFWGVPIDAGAKYDVSLFARAMDWSGEASVTVSLELPKGTVAGSATFQKIGAGWRRYSGVIEATQTADDARLVVTTPGKGTLALDMVSLFPQDTWAGRKNGLRKDLVQSLKDLHPKFFRFPGGCIVHGDSLKDVYHWKDTVGPVEERKPNYNLWGYHQTSTT